MGFVCIFVYKIIALAMITITKDCLITMGIYRTVPLRVASHAGQVQACGVLSQWEPVQVISQVLVR